MSQEHIILLSDLLSLHGQERLSQHALCIASQLSTQDSSAATTQRLAIVNALHGFPERAEALTKSANGGEDNHTACLSAMARAAVCALKGDSEGARRAEVEYLGEVEKGFATVRTEAGRTAADEACAWAGAVSSIVCMQRGNGLGAVRGCVTNLCALMSAVRNVWTATPLTREDGGGRGQEEEGQDGAAVHGEDDAYGLAVGVRGKGSDPNVWRLLHEVAESFRRTGDVMYVMGRCKEAEYYYSQVLLLPENACTICHIQPGDA